MISARAHIFDRISFVVLSCTVLLSLVAFMPGGYISSEVAKGYVLIGGVSLAVIAWLISRLIEGKFHVPNSPVIQAVGVLGIVFFLSALFSKVPYLSFWGNGFDQGAFVPLACSLAALFLGAVLYTSRKRVFAFLSGLFFVYIAVALFQILHILIPSATTLGAFFSSTSTPLGSWADLGYISGGMLVAATLVFEFYQPSRVLRLLALKTAVIAIFFLILTNIFSALLVACIAEICILGYKLMSVRIARVHHFPYLAFFASLALIFFVLAHGVLGGSLARVLDVPYTTASPDAKTTLFVARSTLHEEPVFGAGLNRFSQVWFAHRPLRVNESPLWNVPFLSGYSFLFTIGFLSGILGLLAILFFIGTLIVSGVRRVFVAEADTERNFFVFGMYMLALYFVAVMSIASPGIGVTVLGFFSVGLLIAALCVEGRVRVRTVSFLGEYRIGFFAILGIVSVIILALITIGTATKRFVAVGYFSAGFRAVSDGDVVRADAQFDRASALADIPLFETSRTRLSLAVISRTLSNAGTAPISPTARVLLENAVTTGSVSAQTAVALDPTDPSHSIALGDFLAKLVPLKVENAASSARQAYLAASALAPNYPESYLRLAELDREMGDSAGAIENLRKALLLKTNYVEAYFDLALAYKLKGDTAIARSILSALQARFPNDTAITSALKSL
jgi:hypothetical protein